MTSQGRLAWSRCQRTGRATHGAPSTITRMPARWDQRLPIVVLPEEPERLNEDLGHWLKTHLQERRNTVRFLIPRKWEHEHVPRPKSPDTRARGNKSSRVERSESGVPEASSGISARAPGRAEEAV